MSDRLRVLRDAVLARRGRHVEVTPTGEVRETQAPPPAPDDPPDERKPTKLSARTFGGRSGQS